MSPSRTDRSLTLREIAELDRIIRVSCNYCRGRPRWYDPRDLIRLLGDIEADRVQGRMKCEECGRRDYVVWSVPSLTEVERRQIVVRRLVRIDTVRRPVWREERS